MKLKTHLHESTLAKLQTISVFWGIETPDEVTAADPEALAEHLYPRLQAPGQFRQAFDKLAPRERDMVYFLALHGGEVPFEECRRRTRWIEPGAFEEVLGRLNQYGFVWRDLVSDPILRVELVGIPEPFVRLIDLPPYWQGFLGWFLQQLGTNELLAVARGTLGERLATRKKQALVHYIRKKFLDPKFLHQVLEQRDPLQLEMYQQILQKNGVCTWKELLDAGVHKKFDHQRAERLRDLVEQSGLVYILREGASKYNNLLIVPRDMAYVIQNGYVRDERSLDELTRPGSDANGNGLDKSMRPGVILDNSGNILRDLAIVCAYIQRGQVKMLNNGGIGRNDLKKIVPLLSANKTPKYAAFLALFAMARKLIIAVGDHWRVSGLLPHWLAKGQLCYRDLYEFWLGTSEWNEEYLDGDVVHVDNGPVSLINITELRKLIMRMLEKIPADSWIDFETFGESLMPQIAIEIPGRFDLTPTDKFNRHMILIIESVVAETLYWMGILNLGVTDLEFARQLGSRPNESIAPFDPSHPISPRLIGERKFMFSFKLTDFGRRLFTRPYLDVDKLFGKAPDAELPYAEWTDDFTVQPNLEIVTPPDLRLTKFYRLLQFTDVKKVDVLTVLAISRDSVRSGMDQGLTAEDMINLFLESSRKELPATVRQMIQECETRHGDVNMGLAGGYIVVSERLRLEELRANPKIAPFIKDVIDSKIILLSRTADFKRVAKELQRLGFMPRVDSDSLHVTTEGLFQITLRPEELYDLLAVLRFAMMMEEDARAPVFEDRIQPLYERLSDPAQDRFNPRLYAESIAKAFFGNYEKQSKKRLEDETRKMRKQVNRLMSTVPGRRAPATFKGESPTRNPAEIVRMLKFAVEHEMQVRIRYQRSSGEEKVEVIQPESLQDRKVYAYCPAQDAHHLYAFDRISEAAI